ncbi:MAG: hypothetical protein IKC48_00650, partial [Clostridia bacterium]|nr:hypothetical protein [Clostridia bacterium]
PEPEPATKLGTPVVTISASGLASWGEVANASSYAYKINGGTEIATSATAVQLSSGQSIQVKAVGDGTNYTDSDYSVSQTYTASTPEPQPTKLSAPTVSISASGLASWDAIANASSYAYKINGGTEIATSATAVQLSIGQSIQVKAVGDGVSYTDSDYSAPQTYTASTPEPQPTKLSAPTVSISASGLASWGTVAGASSYAYKINGGTEIATSATAVQLSIGQSIQVKAVGDGTNYTDSDYSVSQTYTASTPDPDPASAPTYLGILASNTEPSSANGVPTDELPGLSQPSLRTVMTASYRSFDEALDEYFADSDNHFDSNFPPESDYDVYSVAGETVYIQIWLNNPNQYTILSLMLNGTKYQVGGGLFSFFINEGAQHYNCVYVAVPIPAGTYTQASYTVTNIEYIANTFINADGTDEFMNNNDTVTVGLPYNAGYPSVSDFEPVSITTNSCSLALSVADAGGLANLSSGWLGVAVYDGYNIVANQKLTIGDNSISASGLVEDTYYTVYVYLYADLHDGYGVRAHTVYLYELATLSAVEELTVEAGYYSNFAIDGFVEADSGLSIEAWASLVSQTATFDRLEVWKGEEKVHEDEFYGYTIVEGLLAETEYLVKVYYSDNEYTEHYADCYVTTLSLEVPEMNLNEKNSFIDAAALVFDAVENGFLGLAITKNIKVRLYNNMEELRYADYILQICDQPGIVDEVRERYEAAIENDDWGLANVIYHEELWPLEYAEQLMNSGDYSDYGTDKQSWQALFAENSVTYTFDDEDMFVSNSTTYLIVREYFEMFGTESCYYEITADVDLKDGRGFVKTTLNDGDFYLNPINHEYNRMSFDFVLDGYSVTVTPSGRINGEDAEITTVAFTVGLYKDWKLVEELYTSEQIDWSEVDEDAWINAYVSAMKGEAILPSEDKIKEHLGWRCLFEILNGVDISAEEDYIGGGNGDITVDGSVGGNGDVTVGGSGGQGEKIIANLAERDLLRELSAYDYPASYEYRIKTQMIQDFERDPDFFALIEGCTTDDEKLESLISGALNSTVVDVLQSAISGLYHYMMWFGVATDEIYVGFKAEFEAYMQENNITSTVNWNESYRRIMMFEDFYAFYPFGKVIPITVSVDADSLAAGKYCFGIKYRYDSYDEDYYDTRYSNTFMVTGVLPTPEITLTEGRYIEARLDIEGFYEYHFEIEYEDASGSSIYKGNFNDFSAWDNPMQVGYRVRVRAVINSWATDSIYTDSEWSDWYVFEGIKLDKPQVGEYSLEICAISWYASSGDGIAYYVYTINGGEQKTVLPDTECSVALQNGDVFRIKAVAAEDGDYIDSDWAEYTCNDNRTQLATPTNIRVQDKLLMWDEVQGASYYTVEYTKSGVPHETRVDYPEYYPQIGVTYRIKALSDNIQSYRASAWSESYTYTVVLDKPVFSEIRRERVYWERVENAQGYNYKVGENGEVKSTRSYYVALSEIPLGEKLYVQAYADGCESTEWVMIYHNVTKLSVPVVTVLGGVASWEAVENASGYLYKINGGEEIATTATSVSGLKANDTVTVCATTDEFGYANSDWSEVKTQLPIMSAPVLDTSLFSSEGTVSWSAVEGADAYEYEIDGSPAVIGETSMSHIAYGQALRVRAICSDGEYEWYGEWCEAVVREDTREQLATPIIAYDPEIGLTVVINDPKVSYYEVMFGQGGIKMRHYPSYGAYEVEVITNSFTFPDNDYTVYVKAVPVDTSNYSDSEWATVTIVFG